MCVVHTFSASWSAKFQYVPLQTHFFVVSHHPEKGQAVAFFVQDSLDNSKLVLSIAS